MRATEMKQNSLSQFQQWQKKEQLSYFLPLHNGCQRYMKCLVVWITQLLAIDL